MNGSTLLSGLPLKAAVATVGADRVDLSRLESLCGYKVDEWDSARCWLDAKQWQSVADEMVKVWKGSENLFRQAGRNCGNFGLLGPLEFLPWFLSTPALLLRNFSMVLTDFDTYLHPEVEYLSDTTCRMRFSALNAAELPPRPYLRFLEGFIRSAVELWDTDVRAVNEWVDEDARQWTCELEWDPQEYRTRRALEELMVESEFFGDLLDGLRRIKSRRRSRLAELVKVNVRLRSEAEKKPSRSTPVASPRTGDLKQQYLSLLTPIYDGLISVDGSGGIAEASSGALALLGYTSFAELQRRYPTINDLFGKELAGIEPGRWKDAAYLNDGALLTLERSDGMPTEVFVFRDGDRGAPSGGANLVLRSPAYHSRHHFELGLTRQFLEAIFLNNPNGLQVIDREGWTLRVNPQLTRMFRFDIGHVVGPGKYSILSDPFMNTVGVAGPLRAALAGEPAHISSVRLYAQPGVDSPFCRDMVGPMVVNLTAYPLKDQTGAVHNVLISYTDMTESDLLQQHLAQIDKLQSIGTLTSGIAHDFNNILGAIVPNADLIINLADSDEQIRKKAMAIKTASKRAAALTQQLVSFAREAHGDKRRLNLNNCVREAVELISNAVPKNVNIDFEAGRDLPDIAADPLQMQQVLINLIINASDALPNGGAISISTDAVDLETRTSFGGNIIIPGTYVRLSVVDEGVGIPIELVERVFDPFFTTKEKGRGTGLGLSVVHGIVKSHKGLINITTSPGKGTRFDVHLPIHDASDESAQLFNEDSDS